MMPFKIRNGQRGQSMIEFVMVLPFIFILLFAIFEWGEIFIRNMRASTIVREAAIAATHDCKYIDPLKATETPQQCVDRLRQEMITNAGFAFPNFSANGEIIISLHGAKEAQAGGTGTYKTQYVAGSVDATVMTALQTIAVGEFYYNNQMMTPIEKMFSFIMPKLIYKATYA